MIDFELKSVQGKVSMTTSGKKRRNKRRTIELIISTEYKNNSEKHLANVKYKYKQEMTQNAFILIYKINAFKMNAFIYYAFKMIAFV